MRVLRYPRQITHHSYIPMVGEGWDNISDIAKDLVARILTKDKDARLTIDQILSHPWLLGDAPSTSLGSDYFTRIKHLVMRQKFKAFFLENDIAADNMARRSEIERMLPFLRQPSELSDTDEADVVEAKKARADSLVDEQDKFQEKLVVLRAFMIQALVKQKKDASEKVPRASEVQRLESGTIDFSELESKPTPIVEGQVDYDTFVSMLQKADLMELADPAIFNIFDIGKTRTIDLKEFLMTMLAFRPATTDTDAARLYFNIFDIRDTGFIDKVELRICLELLLTDDSSRVRPDGTTVVHNVDELFSAMDFTKSGSIDFNEFKAFYETVLTATTVTKSHESQGFDRRNSPKKPSVVHMEPVSEEVPTVVPEEKETRGKEGTVLRCFCSIL